MKKILFVTLVLVFAFLFTACSSEADVASFNMSKEADQFNVTRRVVFYNGITGEYILSIEGLCSLGNNDEPGSLSVVCKTGHGEYKKHFLGLSDNVTYFAEQLEPMPVGVFHYKVFFRPSTILPDIDLQMP